MASFARNKTLGSLAAGFAAIAAILAGTPAHAQTAGLRLMPVGDSITAGYQSSTGNGYRGPLWTELTGQGDPLDYVGSQRSGNMFDPDNEGYYGYRIDQIAGLINGELAIYQNYEVSTAPARLASLIDQILAADPGVTILVAQLICNSTAWVETDIVNYNNQIPAIVQARANAGKHVYMVSMSSLTTSDLSDGLHPNDGGYQKMADNWDAGMKQVISSGWVANINFAGVFEIQNEYSALALDVSGWSTSNGAQIIQWPYGGGSNQLWNFIPTSNGYYQIKNAYSAQDLNVTGASTANGALIVQWPFGNQGNDQWMPVRQSDGSYVLYNRNSGLVLDVPGGSTTEGTQLDQWGANNGANQKFYIGAEHP